MAVMVFYIYEGMDLTNLEDYILYMKTDWKNSTVETNIFSEGIKRIQNKKLETGQWARAHSILFNILSVEIDVDHITVKPLGISILPLHAKDIGATQGFYQLPIFKEAFSMEMIELIKSVEPWGLCSGMTERPDDLKILDASILVRVHIDNLDGWLEKTKFNFDLLNNMLMPSELPKNRIYLTKAGWEKGLRKFEKLSSAFEQKDFVESEVKVYIKEYMEGIRREGFEKLGISLQGIKSLLKKNTTASIDPENNRSGLVSKPSLKSPSRSPTINDRKVSERQ
jgi:hypothetical protein